MNNRLNLEAGQSLRMIADRGRCRLEKTARSGLSYVPSLADFIYPGCSLDESEERFRSARLGQILKLCGQI